MPQQFNPQEKDVIFALDIGTRSVIGILGRVEAERFKVLAIEKEEHGKRAMLDGQIEDIEQVARLASLVRHRLEEKTHTSLQRVCIAAAGRALRTEQAGFQLEYQEPHRIDTELIGHLEAGAVSAAEEKLSDDANHRFYLVGYTVSQYRLDGYPLSTLKGHAGIRMEADVVATFLPGEVVESLYAVVHQMGLEIASLTLEPIASLNAAIPADLRLLNLVLADIGAGTSDIAVCRDGSVVGYTMATTAGDEITELLMRELLVDFKTSEQLKLHISQEGPIPYTDILGLTHEISSAELRTMTEPAAQQLAQEIATRILAVNGTAPSAVFLAGGGSKLWGLCRLVAEQLQMDPKRVALAGSNFGKSAFSEEYDLNDPEYATPLGIAVSAGLGLINDSYLVTLNEQPAKLFRSGALALRDILLMNGYSYADLIGRSGESLSVTVDGRKHFFRGTPATPPELQVNLSDATLSTLVHAGDSISFVPARSGQAAEKKLEELLGTDFDGVAYVNGQIQAPSYSLRNGDMVMTERRRVSAPVVTAGQPVSLPVVPSLSPAPPLAPPPASPATEVERLLYAAAGSTEAAPATAALPVVEAAPAMEVPVPVQDNPPFQVSLNGKELVLRSKAAGQPYFLMDLLEYSGLDFDHLDSPVVLLVNGAAGQFTQLLHAGDQVIIQCQSALANS